MQTFDIPTTETITEQDITNLVITAVEHFGHGAFLYRSPALARLAGEAPSELVARALLAGEQLNVTAPDLVDHPRWPTADFTFGLAAFLDALPKVAAARGVSVRRFLDTADCVAADAVAQYAVFGRLIIG